MMKWPIATAFGLLLSFSFLSLPTTAAAEERHPLMSAKDDAVHGSGQTYRKTPQHDHIVIPIYRRKTGPIHDYGRRTARCRIVEGYRADLNWEHGSVSIGRYTEYHTCVPVYVTPRATQTAPRYTRAHPPILGHSDGPVQVPHVNLTGPNAASETTNFFFGSE
ncbi:hypothetical protein [Actibacterium sp. 188UL27-1]|uniref:hypothetical protein n=1 Tax=Actibacterium sp. 188UL27-1 TaxID=2786961 RepID=UPI00195889C3|nr:hypothetical protein [Actibacterium sp. 188UL27-1]MBM7068363.1 hypothetical protein [Actibacterium sp. 188UL27-1]